MLDKWAQYSKVSFRACISNVYPRVHELSPRKTPNELHIWWKKTGFHMTNSDCVRPLTVGEIVMWNGQLYKPGHSNQTRVADKERYASHWFLRALDAENWISLTGCCKVPIKMFCLVRVSGDGVTMQPDQQMPHSPDRWLMGSTVRSCISFKISFIITWAKQSRAYHNSLYYLGYVLILSLFF